MKILTLSDLHSQSAILTKLDEHLSKKKYAGVFCCGDICDRYDSHALEYAKEFIEIVTQKHGLPLYCVHGNNESDAVKLLYRQKAVSVHFNPIILPKKSTYEVDFFVVGVGYGEEFSWNPDFAKGKILLTHEPPRAETLRQMEKLEFSDAPLVHFAGHLHTIAKVWQLKNSIFVQVPTAQNFRAVVLELPSKKVKFISL